MDFAGFYEHNNKPLGLIEGAFIGQLRDYQFLKNYFAAWSWYNEAGHGELGCIALEQLQHRNTVSFLDSATVNGAVGRSDLSSEDSDYYTESALAKDPILGVAMFRQNKTCRK